MDIIQFSKKAKETSFYYNANTGNVHELSYLALGLAGEAGEVSNEMRKICEDLNRGLQEDNTMSPAHKLRLLDELGDVFWFLVRLCDVIGVTPDSIMGQCDTKLQERHPHAFKE